MRCPSFLCSEFSDFPEDRSKILYCPFCPQRSPKCATYNHPLTPASKNVGRLNHCSGRHCEMMSGVSDSLLGPCLASQPSFGDHHHRNLGRRTSPGWTSSTWCFSARPQSARSGRTYPPVSARPNRARPLPQGSLQTAAIEQKNCCLERSTVALKWKIPRHL